MSRDAESVVSICIRVIHFCVWYLDAQEQRYPNRRQTLVQKIHLHELCSHLRFPLLHISWTKRIGASRCRLCSSRNHSHGESFDVQQCGVLTCCSLSVATLSVPHDLASYNRSLLSANRQEEKRSPVGRLDFKCDYREQFSCCSVSFCLGRGRLKSPRGLGFGYYLGTRATHVQSNAARVPLSRPRRFDRGGARLHPLGIVSQGRRGPSGIRRLSRRWCSGSWSGWWSFCLPQ
jgi:hypothetical protein